MTARKWREENVLRSSLAKTSLSCSKARYYNPNVGRFVSEDPLVYDTGISAYSYADINPINKRDPMGLCAMSPDMYYCLMHIFKEDPDQVKIVEKPDPEGKWSAITRKNKITIYVSCEDFFSDYLIVLEELSCLRAME